MCKKLMKYCDKKIKKLDVWDIALTKLSVAAFMLMIAKLWSGILALPWYIYLILFIAFAVRPMKRTML